MKVNERTKIGGNDHLTLKLYSENTWLLSFKILNLCMLSTITLNKASLLWGLEMHVPFTLSPT